MFKKKPKTLLNTKQLWCHEGERGASRKLTWLQFDRHHSVALSVSLQEGLSAAWVPRDPLPECEESRGRESSDMNHTKGGLVLFTANSHPPSRELGKRIAE